MKWLGFVAAVLMSAHASAAEDDKSRLTSEILKGLELRNIGPALMSGRIADIDIDQNDPATWYISVGSGGVWKTENAGTTWSPLFDKQSVYSIGSLTIDPNNPNALWVGTGENVGGRHVGFGDGVYRSLDGGKTWKNMGMKKSEHISEIIVHPKDSNTVWVASQGPLWSKGGDRGLYKTTDGGKTWRNVLKDGPWTGVTSVVIDPRNPDRLYAATWQHHRTVAAYIGAGPETAIYASSDGGETWEKLKTGLPTGNLGKIGLTISPQNPDVVYAAIEQDQREGGIWRSANRGASWEKMSDEVSGGTGPHYYQELYASPHKFDRIYLASNNSRVSEDGGKTWRTINNENKHVDDHAIAFHPTDPDYIMFGSDGGLYESYDNEKSWRFINNLPVTQFYKVAVDDAEPFYFVYGGTQDNSTQGAPVRTDNRHGIRNSDWFVTLFADGHQPATEPGNPNIVYSSWQQGNLVRHDRITGENVHIQPQPKPGDAPERFNWDAPIFVSQHDPKRLYHSSQRVWRSDDRGDSWTPISPDLTRNQDRMKLPVMDRQWSWEAGWDLLAMSEYNSITSFAESPKNENLLYIGTDDGIIQITEDGGKNWRKIEAGKLPGVPETAFVNDIRADLFDENTVYIALDNHKYGDYKPYLLKSTNRGKSWKSIASDLPEKHLVWRIVQDHVKPNLMFAATEFGMFVTVDGGKKWTELAGTPTISFRDAVIQRRENDLVAGSFGRGIFVLDDYTPLRDITEDSLSEEALLHAGRDAWWYMEQHPLAFIPGGYQGHSYYRAPNPPFGAVFTYYLRDGYETAADKRKAREKELVKAGKNTPFPGFDAIDAEKRAEAPQVWLMVSDADGNVIRRIKGSTKKGVHRINWDLRYPRYVVKDVPSYFPIGDGAMVAPGTYKVSLVARVNGETRTLVEPKDFTVKPLREGALPGADAKDYVAFTQRLNKSIATMYAAGEAMEELEKKFDRLKVAIARSQTQPAELDNRWAELRKELHAIEVMFNGVEGTGSFGASKATIGSRLSIVQIGTAQSTYGPTKTHLEQLGYAEAELKTAMERLLTLQSKTLPEFEAKLIAVGAPWSAIGAPIPGEQGEE